MLDIWQNTTLYSTMNTQIDVIITNCVRQTKGEHMKRYYSTNYRNLQSQIICKWNVKVYITESSNVANLIHLFLPIFPIHMFNKQTNKFTAERLKYLSNHINFNALKHAINLACIWRHPREPFLPNPNKCCTNSIIAS